MFNLKNVTVLTKAQQKNVRGGAVQSSYCGTGEKLYTCKYAYANGNYSEGVICASSSLQAAQLANDGIAERFSCS